MGGVLLSVLSGAGAVETVVRVDWTAVDATAGIATAVAMAFVVLVLSTVWTTEMSIGADNEC